MINNLVYRLMLEMVFGAGSTKLHSLMNVHEDPAELYYTLHDPGNGVLTERERKLLRQTSRTQVEGILDYCEKHGIGVLSIEDESYPERLRHIYNPPRVLFYKGNVSLLQAEPLLTVVGARSLTEYCRRVTDHLCRNLAKMNVIIVSGGAVGADAAAHWAAIKEGKPTIAVMGCGVDYDYPKDNRALREQIVQNGLLLSEYFPGTQPHPSYFPIRNRILAGISEGTLVTQAGERSGSLITANLACENSRHVFCVPPGDVFDARYRGVVPLLRDGAIPAFDELDVLQELYQVYPHRIAYYNDEDASVTEDSQLFRTEEKPKKKRTSAAKEVPASAEKPTETNESKPFVIPEEALPKQRRILELLQNGAMNVNAVCAETGLAFEEVSMLLMEMEMNGWIMNTERDRFKLSD